MDSIFLALVVDRAVSFLAKAEYFDRRRTRGSSDRPGRSRCGGATPWEPDERSTTRSACSIGAVSSACTPRDPVTRRELHRGNLGPARLAAASGAPIVPVGLVGTDEVQAPDQRLPRLRKRVAVRFGQPIRLQPSENQRGRLRDVTDELMADIAELCGQPYDDHYAGPKTLSRA